MNATEVVLILDRSGSMGSIEAQARSGANEFLAAHAAEVTPTRFSLVLFDHEVELAVDHQPASAVKPLDATTYRPRGSTALLDAVGWSIDQTLARLAMDTAADRPKAVVVGILTDGFENASRRVTWEGLQARIADLSNQGWEFQFLGANQDAIATACRMGIGADKAATFAANADGTDSASEAMRMKSLAARRVREGRSTAEDQRLHSRSTRDVYEESMTTKRALLEERRRLEEAERRRQAALAQQGGSDQASASTAVTPTP